MRAYGVATAVLILTIAQSADAICGKFKGQPGAPEGQCAPITLKQNPHGNPVPPKTLACSLSPDKSGTMVYKPANGDKRFIADDFR